MLEFCLVFKKEMMVKKIQLKWRRKKNLEQKQIQNKVAVDSRVDCTQWAIDRTCQQQETENREQLSLLTGSSCCRQTDTPVDRPEKTVSQACRQLVVRIRFMFLFLACSSFFSAVLRIELNFYSMKIYF